jgi:hypothetical protein
LREAAIQVAEDGVRAAGSANSGKKDTDNRKGQRQSELLLLPAGN